MVRELQLRLKRGLALVGIVLLFFLFPVQVVRGESMYPTFDNGDVVLTMRTAFADRGTAVTCFCSNKDGESAFLLKRIVAVEGDTVSISNGFVYVNGSVSSTGAQLDRVNGSMEEVRVPDGCVFVLGDNRNRSYDSREFGCIPMKSVYARVIFNFTKQTIVS